MSDLMSSSEQGSSGKPLAGRLVDACPRSRPGNSSASGQHAHLLKEETKNQNKKRQSERTNRKAGQGKAQAWAAGSQALGY